MEAAELFYYTFPKDEKHNYEVDFLLPVYMLGLV